jgi:hypothetical protein
VIVVDTSVWVAARRNAQILRVLDTLVDADEVALALPVRLTCSSPRSRPTSAPWCGRSIRTSSEWSA